MHRTGSVDSHITWFEGRSVFFEAPTKAIVFVDFIMRRMTSSLLWNGPDILENLTEFPTANANLHLMKAD